jgi:hypothetical protein
MKYSRISRTGERDYLASTAVLLSEISKLIICLFIHINDEISLARKAGSLATHTFTLSKLIGELFGKDSGWILVLVPAVICTYYYFP